MVDRDVGAVLPRAVAELEHAAGVGGHDRLRVGRGDGPHFVAQEILRHGGMSEIVDPGAAAAAIGTLHFKQLQSGNGLNELSGLRANALAMSQMTGVLIGHSYVELRELSDKTQLGEKL